VNELDLDRFLAICTAGTEDAAAMADFYLSYMSGQLEALHAAIAEQRIGEIEQIAHRCAGSSATFGMGPMVDPLIALEKRAHSGDLHDALELEHDARTAFAQVEKALRDLVARQSPP
jgi:HPt (histidine-containing phosphotransfer) domain-containing protein